jgi:hypothetical protein
MRRLNFKTWLWVFTGVLCVGAILQLYAVANRKARELAAVSKVAELLDRRFRADRRFCEVTAWAGGRPWRDEGARCVMISGRVQMPEMYEMIRVYADQVERESGESVCFRQNVSIAP